MRLDIRSKPLKAIGIFIGFVALLVCVHGSFANDGPPDWSRSTPQTNGILTIQGTNEITVNGTNTISSATILSGASIETPDKVRATVNVGRGASLGIDPNTKLTVQFQPSGVRVMLTEGCVVLSSKQGTTGEIAGLDGFYQKRDPVQDGRIDTCPGKRLVSGDRPRAAGLFSLGKAAAVTVIGKGATGVAVPIAARGILY